MAIKLPIQQTEDRQLNTLQQQWSAALTPFLSLPLSTPSILTNVTLSAGLNTVSHGLGRTLIGWYPVRVRSNSALWDSQDTNSNPSKTLLLNATSAVVVDLVVF